VTPRLPCYIVPRGAKMARKPTAEVQLKLRFSESLRRRREREAARNGRSMNSEIISRLEQSLDTGNLAQQIAAALLSGHYQIESAGGVSPIETLQKLATKKEKKSAQPATVNALQEAAYEAIGTMYKSADTFHIRSVPEQQREQYDKKLMEAADRLRGALGRFRSETEGENK
jgi:Arc-like DNA binding domain